jgi:hypothetical protein
MGTAMSHTYNRFSALFLAAGLLPTDCPPATAGTTEEAGSRLANASYQGIENAPVQLKNGRWEGEPYVEGGASRPAVGLVEDFTLRGNLNGDGVNESVVLLWQSSSGSGTFKYIAVMAEVNGNLTNVATAPVGDRVQLRSSEISKG